MLNYDQRMYRYARELSEKAMTLYRKGELSWNTYLDISGDIARANSPDCMDTEAQLDLVNTQLFDGQCSQSTEEVTDLGRLAANRTGEFCGSRN